MSIEIGVDEMTIVFQAKEKLRKEYMQAGELWENLAEGIIGIIEDKAQLINIYGKKNEEKNNPMHYNCAYKYGYHDFYFAIAYNDANHKQGIIMKYSAKSLAYYIEKSGMLPYEIFQKLESDIYDVDLTRIDITVDYIDLGIELNELYKGLVDESIIIYMTGARKKVSKRKYKPEIKGFYVGDKIGTIYVGSSRSDRQLRVYDKKQEQIDTKGINLKKAIHCQSWVRFEAVFKKDFAKQITKYLLKVSSEVEYLDLLMSVFLQKYSFYDTNHELLYITKSLTEYTLDDKVKLKSYNAKNNDLENSIRYLIGNSGLMSTTHKILHIWGDSGVDEFVKFFLLYLENWKVNDDCKYWLKNNANDYKCNYDSFERFVNEEIKR